MAPTDMEVVYLEALAECKDLHSKYSPGVLVVGCLMLHLMQPQDTSFL